MKNLYSLKLEAKDIERESETVEEEAGQIPLLLRYRTPENKEPTRLVYGVYI